MIQFDLLIVCSLIKIIIFNFLIILFNFGIDLLIVRFLVVIIIFNFLMVLLLIQFDFLFSFGSIIYRLITVLFIHPIKPLVHNFDIPIKS